MPERIRDALRAPGRRRYLPTAAPPLPAASWAAWTGILASGVLFVAALAAWSAGGGGVNLPWAPTWGLRLAFRLDGLAALYTLLITGIGLFIFAYARRYVPLHLRHQERPLSEAARFHALLLLFMLSMVGLVTAQDLLLLFVFWELTTVVSYFLIAYDRQQPDARAAALTALLVTGITGILLLLGAAILFAEYGTFSLPELVATAGPGAPLTVAMGLMGTAALAKSAQVPFHFWLPRAMAAPTPVSAYLHSAAMVAAGVFLLERTYPLLQRSDPLLDLLLGFAVLSMAVGGVLALAQRVLKQILAYSTIAQYGYVAFLLGLDDRLSVTAASFYVLAHAVLKSSLFLTAGAVTEATGRDRLDELGGLGRPMPWLAAGGGAAAAGLAGLPLTIGFFKDELFFAATVERGWPYALVAAASAALTLAYTGRFWGGIFLGAKRTEAHGVPGSLIGPVVLLGAVAVLGGVVVGPFAGLAEAAAEAALGAPAAIEPAYHLALTPETALTLGAYATGALFLLARPVRQRIAAALATGDALYGPARWYGLTLQGLDAVSDRLHDVEVRNLRGRIVTILAPTGILVAAGWIATPTGGYIVGAMDEGDIPLLVALVLAAGSAVATTLPRNHLTIVLALSAVGFTLAVVYAFFGGPDVALVVVLVETIFVLFFLGVLALFPREILRRAASVQPRRWHRWADPVLGALAGAFAFIVVWSALSHPSGDSAAFEQLRLTPAVHAGDAVTAIVADFRGLDTMGEITVIGITLVGVFSLLRRRRAL